MPRPAGPRGGEPARADAIPGPAVYRGRWSDGARVAVVVLPGRRAPCPTQTWEALRVAVETSPDLRAVAGYGGSALALAAFVAASRQVDLPAPSFAISVGEAVRRGLPTAARATITGPAPLRSGLVEAPFGGQFARAFARSTDVLFVFGGVEQQRTVIAIDARGDITLSEAAFGAEDETLARALALGRQRHSLLVGPAAESGIPFANLGSWSAPEPGQDFGAPSLVGRGGLGATVAAAGVTALTVEAQGPRQPDAPGDLTLFLESSPRLLSRAKGGTLELGSVRRADGSRPALGRSGEDSIKRQKHGCEGCPTPCGWQFSLSAGSNGPGEGGAAGQGVGGRFAALQGFLGAGPPDKNMPRALAALQVCNQLGVDARTAALVVGERIAASGDALGAEDPAALVRELTQPGSSLRERALALRPRGDVEPANALMPGDLAGRVGVALAARGPEPLRSLSVLGLSVLSEQRQLAKDLLLEGLRGDAEYDAGVIAHWHECFSAALDLTGFCAFSASALLADGVLTLDELSERVSSRMTGAEWLLAGSRVAALHREWNGTEGSGYGGAKTASLPDAAVRGFFEALSSFQASGHGRTSESVAAPSLSITSDEREPSAAPAPASATVAIRASGALATRLLAYPGAREVVDADTRQRFLRIDVPVGSGGSLGTGPGSGASDSVSGVLGRIADAVPKAGPWLIREDGGVLPAVLIAGRAVAGDRLLEAGEEAELILVIPGG